MRNIPITDKFGLLFAALRENTHSRNHEVFQKLLERIYHRIWTFVGDELTKKSKGFSWVPTPSLPHIFGQTLELL